jgi:hypothetical protein
MRKGILILAILVQFLPAIANAVEVVTPPSTDTTEGTGTDGVSGGGGGGGPS